MRPFISMVGVTSVDEVEETVVPEEYGESGHDVVFGVLASNSSLRDGVLGTRYVGIDGLDSMLSAIRTNGLRSSVHYCTRDANDEEIESITRVMRKNFCDLIQLNISNPYVLRDVVKRIRREGSASIVFQLNNSLKRFFGGERRAATYLYVMYEEGDYVILDYSGGKGREVVPDDVASFLEWQSSSGAKSMSMVVAGGLDPDNIAGRVREIGAELSYDAESGLREYPDQFSTSRASKFLSEFLLAQRETNG